MKKIVLTWVIAMTAMMGFAQQADTKTPEQRASGIVKNIEKEAALTAEQTPKVLALQIGIIEKADKIRAKYADGDKKAMQKELKAVNEAGMAEIKALLTDEQKVKFDAWQERRKEEMKNRQSGGNN